jgi:hypothetical protein
VAVGLHNRKMWPVPFPERYPVAKIAAQGASGLVPFEISGLHEPGLRHSPPLFRPPPNTRANLT